MKYRHFHPYWLLAGLLLQSGLAGCGGEDGAALPTVEPGRGGGGAMAPAPTGGSGVGQAGSNGKGGGSVATGTGGANSGVGGNVATGNGGTVSSTGGANAGGTAPRGGSASGGKATGGTNSSSTGGTATGGKATGGTNSSSTGGTASGGKATGGTNSSSTGGTATGGKTTGGTNSSSTGGTATGGTATGGTNSSPTGGAATGGAGTGGAATGGKATGGTATGGTSSTPSIGPASCGCTTSSGEFSGNQVSSTIVIDSGENYDGGCKTFRANPSTLGPGDQTENQSPVFRVNGGTLSNVILGASAADGIHIYGNTTLKNIHWLDIGEDAMTIKAAATMTLDCGSSNLGEDKTFQVNAASTITIKNFTAKNAGKFMRQNGDTTFEMSVTIDHCDISNMDECIYRTDSTTSTVTMTNTRYSNVGDSLFIFGSTNVNGNSSQSTVTNCQSY